MTRNKAREILMQIMYEMDMSKTMDRNTAEALTEKKLSGNHMERGRRLILSIINNLPAIDDEINRHSRSWKTSRMPKVDLAIMRLASGELKYNEDVPQAVVINEAINMAKKYGTERSARFVHGVLGAIANDNEQ